MAEGGWQRARRVLPTPRRRGRAQSGDELPLVVPSARDPVLRGTGAAPRPRAGWAGGRSQRTPHLPPAVRPRSTPLGPPPSPGTTRGDPAHSPAPAPAPRTPQSRSHPVPEHAQRGGRRTTRSRAAPPGNGSSACSGWHGADAQHAAGTKPGKTGLEAPRSGARRLLRLIHAQVCTRRRPRRGVAAPVLCPCGRRGPSAVGARAPADLLGM